LAQTKVWQTEVSADNVDLRQPLSVTLASLTVDLPADGRVFVKFDGNCTSTPGDRIALAAANIPDWDTNDGNTSCQIYDPLNATACFNHSRVYDASAGSHTYYAVGQNYVNTQGTGIASIYGHLTVIYVANNDPQTAMTGTGIVLGPISWNGPVYEFGSISITVPVSGQILVNFDGYVALNTNDEVLYTTNLSTDWPNHPEITSISMGSDYFESRMIHRKSYPVGPGTYEIYALGQKVNGELNSTTDYIYATLSAQFIPDNSNTIDLQHQLLDGTGISQGAPQNIGHLDINAQMDGKALIQFTGRTNSSYADLFNLTLEPTGMPGTILGSVQIQPIRTSDAYTTFSVSGAADLTTGVTGFDVVAEFDPSSSGSGAADISGLLSVLFVANNSTTGVHETRQDLHVSLYPNPTTGLVYGHLSEIAASPFKLSVYSSAGQVLQQTYYENTTDFRSDLRGLPDGAYLIGVKLDGDENETLYRIVKSAPR